MGKFVLNLRGVATTMWYLIRFETQHPRGSSIFEYPLEQVGNPGGRILPDLFFFCGQH